MSLKSTKCQEIRDFHMLFRERERGLEYIFLYLVENLMVIVGRKIILKLSQMSLCLSKYEWGQACKLFDLQQKGLVLLVRKQYGSSATLSKSSLGS